jgi:hypothetical protein
VKDYLRQLVEAAENDILRSGLAREYLQARALEALQDAGVFLRWAFVGGTALRFLYSIPRFSEDLDFSLIRPGDDAQFAAALTGVKQVLVREGYRVEIAVNDRKTVASAWIRFPGLPYELGISPHVSRVLSIKLELDTRPPAGAVTATSLVRRHVTLNICHYDRASLLAGKLHALFSRKWTKGRDLYDLAWYLADRQWPAPNLALLNAALAQTSRRGSILTADTWRAELRRRLATVDWPRARDDVRPFLERDRDVELISLETLDRLLADAGATRDGAG